MNRMSFRILVALFLFSAVGCKRGGATVADASAPAATGSVPPASRTPVAPPPDASTPTAMAPSSPTPSAPRAAILDAPFLELIPAELTALFAFPTRDETGRLWAKHLERNAKALGIRGGVAQIMSLVALGFTNPFDSESRRRWGLASGSWAALAILGDGDVAVSVLPIADFAAFEARVQSQIGSQAGTRVQKSGDGIVRVDRAEGPLFAYARKGSSVVIAPGGEGGDPARQVRAVLALEPTKSLARAAGFGAAMRHAGTLRDGFVYFDGDGVYRLQRRELGTDADRMSVRRVYDVLRGLAVGLTLGERNISLDAFATLGAIEGWRPAFPGARAGASLLRFVTADPALVAAMTIDPRKVLHQLLAIEPGARDALVTFYDGIRKRMGIRLEDDVMGNASGSIAFAIFGVHRGFWKALDGESVFDALAHLDALLVAEVKDAAVMRKVIDTAVTFVQKQGAAGRVRIATRLRAGRSYSLVHIDGKPAVAVALEGSVLLAARDAARMENVLALLGGKPAGFVKDMEPATRDTFAAGDDLAVYADVARLALATGGASGGATDGFGKALQKSLLLFARELRGVTLRGKLEAEGLRVIGTIRTRR